MKRLFFSLLLVATSACANVVHQQPQPLNVAIMLATADTMLIWEGLPRPDVEGVLFKQETKKPHRKIAGEFFYIAGLDVSAEDHSALSLLFRNGHVFTGSTTEKFCGGFHADYAIEWKKGEERLVAVLICFGCGEAIVVSPQGEQRTDVTKTGIQTLVPLLKKYRLSRPPFTLRPKAEPKVLPPKLDLKPAP